MMMLYKVVLLIVPVFVPFSVMGQALKSVEIISNMADCQFEVLSKISDCYKSPDFMSNRAQVATKIVTKQTSERKDLEKLGTLSRLPLEKPQCFSPVIAKTDDCVAPTILEQTTNFTRDITFSMLTSVKKENRFPTDDCTCESVAYDEENLILNQIMKSKKLDQKKDELEKLVLSSYGEKFMNNFTSQNEDLSYFMNMNKHALVDGALDFQCQNVPDYKKAVDSQCGSKMTDNEIDNRLKSILGVSFSELPAKFKQVGNDLNAIPTGMNSPKLYTREDLDASRDRLRKDDKSLKFADVMTAMILKSPFLKAKVIELISKNTSPAAAFSLVISEAIQKDPKYLITLPSDVKDSSFVKKILSLGSEGKSSNTQIQEVYENLMINHPGFGMALSSKESFKKFSNITGNYPLHISFVDMIELERKTLNEEFKNRCDQLKDEFAKVICIPKDGVLSQIDATTAKNLAHKKISKDVNLSNATYNKILCEAKGKTSKAFSNLDVSSLPADLKSDYMSRILYGGKSADIMTLTMKDFVSKTKAGEYLRGSVVEAATTRSPMLSPDRLGSTVMAENSAIRKAESVLPRNVENTTPQNNIIEKDNVDVNPTRNEFQYANAPSNSFKGFQSNIPVPTQVISSSSPADNKMEETRNELKQFLSDSKNKKKVEKLVNSVDEASLQELKKLKDASAKDRLKILELASENEKLKLKGIEDQIKALEEKRNIAAIPLVKEPEEGPSNETSASRDNASFSPSEAVSGNSGQTLTDRASKDSGNLAPLREAAVTSLLKKGTSSKNSDPLVISGKQGMSGGLEIKSSELNQELMAYLSENVNDVKTLLQIKDSGMIYRYKVLENGKYVEKEILVNYNGLDEKLKKLIDSKISKTGTSGLNIVKMDHEIAALKRSYSYSALKIILGEQLRK